VFSGRGLCDELITRSEESYRKLFVVVWYRNLKNGDVIARVEMVLETSVDHLMRLLVREYFTEKYETINLTNKNPSFHKLYYIN